MKLTRDNSVELLIGEHPLLRRELGELSDAYSPETPSLMAIMASLGACMGFSPEQFSNADVSRIALLLEEALASQDDELIEAVEMGFCESLSSLFSWHPDAERIVRGLGPRARRIFT